MTINIFVLKGDLNGKIVVVPFFFCRVYNRLFCCNPTFYYVGMAFVTSASRYVTSASRYQSRSSMYIRGMIPLNSTELAEAVPIDSFCRFRNNYDVGMIYVFCFFLITRHVLSLMSRGMRFPTMWYVRPAKSQISLRIVQSD